MDSTPAHPAPLPDQDRLDLLERDLALVDLAMAQVDEGDLDGFDLTVAPLLASEPEPV